MATVASQNQRLRGYRHSVAHDLGRLLSLHRLTLDVQRFDAVNTIAHPFPTLSAPVKIWIAMAGHQAETLQYIVTSGPCTSHLRPTVGPSFHQDQQRTRWFPR